MDHHPSITKPDNLRLTIRKAKEWLAEEKPFALRFWKRPIDLFIDPPNPNDPEYQLGSGIATRECGFAACLGGYMTLDPEHNALGFYTSSIKDGFPRYHAPDEDDRDIYSGFDAMANFWGIKLDEDDHYDDGNEVVSLIADKGNYPFPNPGLAEVIVRLEDLLKHGDPLHSIMQS